MIENYSGESTARSALKVVGKGAIKAFKFTTQEVGAYQERQRLKRKADIDTRLARAAMGAGGFVDRVPGGLLINDRQTFEEHEIAKGHSALSSAAVLALKATEASPKWRINDVEVVESDSFLVVDGKYTTRIKLKSSDQYSLVKFKNFDEWTVSPEPITNPNTGNTLVAYYGRGYHLETYDDTGKLVKSGGGSYLAPHDDPTERAALGFESASKYIARATQEIAQSAYSDLIAQGLVITDDIQKVYEHATSIQPARYYEEPTLLPSALRGTI